MPIMLFVITLSINSCKENNQEKSAEKNITSFATAYFNWDFPEAQKYTQKRAQYWLTFLASGITEKDIDAIKAKDQPAKIEVEYIDIESTYPTSTISVYNYLSMDSIGKEPKLCEHCQFTIPIIKENGTWKCGKPIKIK